MRVAAGLMLVTLPAAVHAEETEVDVPAGVLGQAAATLSRQARIDVGVEDGSLARVATPPVRGRMSAHAALDRLLRGTPATWKRGRGGLYHIVPRPRAAVVTAPRAELTLRSQPARAPAPPIEIVVTASKRASPLASYAGTAVVLDGEGLSEGGTVIGSHAVTLRHAGVGSTHFGSGRNKLFLRGIIDSSFNGPTQATTAQYVDHVRINYNGPDPDLRLVDVAAVEVLEGPQGTLYGTGTLGGLIRVVTRPPQFDRVSAEASIGASFVSHGRPGGDASLILNLPLTREVGARAVAYTMRDGGYLDNPSLGLSNTNGVSVRGGRAALRIIRGDWTFDLGGAMQSIRADDSHWSDSNGPPLLRTIAAREPYGSHYRHASLTAARTAGDVDVVWNLSVVRRSMTQRFGNGTSEAPLLVTQRDGSELVVSETRVTRHGPDGTGWVIGLSVLDSRSRTTRSDGLGTGAAGNDETVRQCASNLASEITLFGEAGVRLAPMLVATAGLRLGGTHLRGAAWAKENLVAWPGNGKPMVAALTRAHITAMPSFALSLRPSASLLLYARYQRGFRAGGVGMAGYRPEVHRGDSLDSWEIGQRWTPRDDDIELAMALSFARWDGILAEVVSQSGDLMTTHIGDGEILTVEAHAAWRLSPAWTLRGGVSLNQSRLTRSAIGTITLKGARLPNVPRVGLQASLRREWTFGSGFGVSLSVDLRYVGRSRIGAGPLLDTEQGDYLDDRILLRIGRAGHGFSIQVVNLTDSRQNRFALGTPYRIQELQTTPQPPRAVRLGFDAVF